jgi:hypothetical protein
MRNLFYLLLILMSGISCITAITATTTEVFVLGTMLMCLATGVFLISSNQLK